MKKFDFLLLLIILLTVAVAFFMFIPPLRSQGDLKQQLIEAQTERDQLRQKLFDLEQKIDRLNRGDRDAIEEVARDKFGYSREGEQVYQIESPSPDAAGTSATPPAPVTP